MEQRALLAVALVAGCVTAAGAGGYLAVRQMAGPESPSPTELVARAEPEAIEPDEGTEGEVLPAVAPDASGVDSEASTPPTARPSREQAPRETVERPRSTAAVARPVPATTRSTVPAPPPTPAAARRQEPDAWPTAPASRPSESGTTASGTPDARSDDWGTSDTSPSRDAATAPRDDRWPSRDTDTTTADGSLPARVPATEPVAAPAPVRRLEAVTIPADSVIGVQLETSVSSQTARVEDPVRARVTRDVRSGGTVIVPAGSRLLGSVTLVEEGGKIRDRARLGVRFHTLVLADGTELRLPTETIYRDGDSPAGRSAAKIGGAAAGGAILGAILGGGKGALIGAATGAGSGTAVAMAGDRRPAELKSGQPITVRVTDDVTTHVEP